MRNRILLVSLAVMLAVSMIVVGACAKPTPTTPTTTAQPKTFKIGAIDALTGFMSPGELPMNLGEQVFVQWLNDNGGFNVNGQQYMVELVIEDNKSTAEGSIAAATKLVGEGIRFFIGGVAPHENVALNSVLTPAGALRNSNYECLNPAELGPDTPLTFAGSTAGGGLRPLLAYLKEIDPTAKTLAWIAPADGGFADRQNFFGPIAKEAGFEVIYTAEYPLETQDFTPVVQKALKAGADVLFAFDGWPYHIGSITKTARALGYKGPMFSTPPDDIRDIIAVAGAEAAEGYFGASWDVYSPQMPPIMKTIVKMSEAKTGGKANFWHSFGWHTTWSLIQAITSAQSLDPVVVADHWSTMKTIETPTGTGTMGGLKTFGINNVNCSPLWIVRVHNGDLESVKTFGAGHTP
jgi:branched-chain amino acid transport system substrate-binding protein